MDRDEALKLLRGGRDGLKEWNRRRKADEEIPDLTGVDLSHTSLAGAMLGGALLSSADFRGSDLSNADLQGAVLIFANLSGADLHDTRLSHARLIAADLMGANLVGADLTSAHLIKTHLSQSKCAQATLRDADLSHADLTGADFTGADLSGALLVDAVLSDISLKSANLDRAAVTGVKYDRRRITCRGVRVDTCYGNAVFKRDAQDQDWIETFRSQSRRHYVMYLLWLLLTDCGRSLTRVGLAATLLALTFGVVYDCFPGLLNVSHSANTVWTPYYYSIVTFTTLGFGDVTPEALAGELLVTLEVLLGYITLGVLVSILANKVARRS